MTTTNRVTGNAVVGEQTDLLIGDVTVTEVGNIDTDTTDDDRERRRERRRQERRHRRDNADPQTTGATVTNTAGGGDRVKAQIGVVLGQPRR
ncbi:hypothetical protein [Actinokineospora inagensis]|uniref:hypothetical protein n=1 Tax=Actinokineospora inagensis TaxID=103730 RepID=UPI0012F881EE|nr:hypothetical protein [Actinokineospora inagensis]